MILPGSFYYLCKYEIQIFEIIWNLLKSLVIFVIPFQSFGIFITWKYFQNDESIRVRSYFY